MKLISNKFKGFTCCKYAFIRIYQFGMGMEGIRILSDSFTGK